MFFARSSLSSPSSSSSSSLLSLKNFTIHFCLITFLIKFSFSVPINNCNNNNNSNKTSNDDDNSMEQIEDVRSLRLPNETLPISYDLHITTNVHRCDERYDGYVNIKLKVVNNTDRIVLHAGNFTNIKLHLIDVVDSSEFNDITYSYDNLTMFLTIYSNHIPLDLKKGKEYNLAISYKAHLNTDKIGFFKSKYLRPGASSDVCFGITDFQPINARQAFPCYDEPSIKANFKISVTHGNNVTAISNMPEDGNPILSENGDMITTRFQQTPPMSTYIVAFAIINHEHISNDKYNVTHRVFFPHNFKEKANFALEIATESVKKLEDYFEIDFALPKIDHLGIQGRYSEGMENWGLIIYEEEHFLKIKSNNSNLSNMNMALLIIHELTHQWFGNLVTPNWWSCLWLSEGLTNFYANKIINMIRPEWNAKEYNMFSMRYSMYTLQQREPLTHYVEAEADLERRFETQTYFSAPYVLQMFEHALTEKTFRKGIMKYLKDFQYSSADEDDLFDSLQAAATEDEIPYFKESGIVKNAMKKWTRQVGHPVITVTRNYKTGELILNQTAFRHYNRNNTIVDSDELWYIPITFATATEPNFEETTTDFVFPNIQNIGVIPNKSIKEDDWIIFNKQQIGPYRVQYDEQNWKLIIAALKTAPNVIHTYNKAQLVRDAFAFFRADMLTDEIFTELLQSLKDNDDLMVFMEMQRVLNDLRIGNVKIALADDADNFTREYVQKIFKKYFDNIKCPDNAFSEEYRLILMELACDVKLEECVDFAKKMFDDLIGKRLHQSQLDKWLRMEIYREGITNLKQENYEVVRDYLDNIDNPAEQAIFIGALTRANNTEFFIYLLDNSKFVTSLSDNLS